MSDEALDRAMANPGKPDTMGYQAEAYEQGWKRGHEVGYDDGYADAEIQFNQRLKLIRGNVEFVLGTAPFKDVPRRERTA